MSRNRKRRGLSLGTVFMCLWTILVVAATVVVLPQLSGDTVVAIDAGSMLQSLSLSDGLPELSLSDIPIRVTTAQPEATPDVNQPEEMQPKQTTELPSVSPAPQTTPVPTPTPYTGGSFTMTIAGSIRMDEAVRKSGYYSEANTYDFAELLSLINDEWTGDITLASLENLVIPEKKVSALIAPEAALKMMKESGVNLVALGFPKAFDQNLSGVQSTIAAAENAGLRVLGAYAAEDTATGVVVNANGIQVGLLHYTQSLSSNGAKSQKKADAAYAVPVLKVEKVASDIEKLRSNGAQVIVVSVNWDGSKTTPAKSQTALSQQIADAGADVIVGTGTGIVQPAVWLETTGDQGEKRKVLCAYSLGSLLNESRNNGSVASMLLQLTISVDGAGHVAIDRAEYTPTYIWRYKQDSKYFYRVVASDQPAPDGMGDEQTEVMQRAFDNLKKYLGEETILDVRKK